MKSMLKKLTLIALVVMSSAMTNTLQADPPPQPAGGHGQAGDQPAGGGTATIYGGAAFLIGLAVGYGTCKFWADWKATKINHS